MFNRPCHLFQSSLVDMKYGASRTMKGSFRFGIQRPYLLATFEGGIPSTQDVLVLLGSSTKNWPPIKVRGSYLWLLSSKLCFGMDRWLTSTWGFCRGEKAEVAWSQKLLLHHVRQDVVITLLVCAVPAGRGIWTCSRQKCTCGLTGDSWPVCFVSQAVPWRHSHLPVSPEVGQVGSARCKELCSPALPSYCGCRSPAGVR